MGTVPVGWTGKILDVNTAVVIRLYCIYCNPGLMGLIDRDVVWLPSLRLELRSSNTYISVLQDVGTNQIVYCVLNNLSGGRVLIQRVLGILGHNGQGERQLPHTS